MPHPSFSMPLAPSVERLDNPLFVWGGVGGGARQSSVVPCKLNGTIGGRGGHPLVSLQKVSRYALCSPPLDPAVDIAVGFVVPEAFPSHLMCVFPPNVKSISWRQSIVAKCQDTGAQTGSCRAKWGWLICEWWLVTNAKQ
jgi:hypothetical protein